MPRSIFATTLVTLTLTACAPSAPRLHQPDHISAFCGDRAAIMTAIESIVSSTGDAAGGEAVPSAQQIRKQLDTNGGIIAHWNDQQLYQPSLAKKLGLTGDYVTLGDAAIANGSTVGPAGNDSRPIYLTVRGPSGPQTFALRAYDVQDVCNQGKLSS